MAGAEGLVRYRKGVFIWTPYPAAAGVAIEELRKARHKHTDSAHLFVVPRLMGPYWRKHVWKVADVIVEVARFLGSMSKHMVSKVLSCRSGFEIPHGAPGERRGIAVEARDRG